MLCVPPATSCTALFWSVPANAMLLFGFYTLQQGHYI